MAPPVLVVRFEDRSMIVVDKPAGMHTAPLRQGETGTLLEAAISAFPEIASLPGVKPVEPGLVHRIDRETSGLVILARTAEAFATLRGQFAAGDAHKRYLAACAPGPDDPGRAPALRIESRFAPYGISGRMVRVVLPGEPSTRRSRQATRERYVTEVTGMARSPGRVLLSASIARGFRHQVRAHLSFLGFPILGDRLYGTPVPEGFAERMYLHAARIELRHPVTGAPLVVESPVPPEFAALFP